MMMQVFPLWVLYGNCRAVEVMEMPRAFSMSIQSETVARRPALPWIAPASVMALAWSTSASVNVDLPASGWLITAKVLRRCASAEMRAAAGPAVAVDTPEAVSVIRASILLAPASGTVIADAAGFRQSRANLLAAKLKKP